MNDVLTDKTAVFGYFEEVEIGFTVGDCKRMPDGIKVSNIRNTDDKNNKALPPTISLSDGRLDINPTIRRNIRAYFSIQQTNAPLKKTSKKPEKQNIRRGICASH